MWGSPNTGKKILSKEREHFLIRDEDYDGKSLSHSQWFITTIFLSLYGFLSFNVYRHKILVYSTLQWQLTRSLNMKITPLRIPT